MIPLESLQTELLQGRLWSVYLKKPFSIGGIIAILYVMLIKYRLNGIENHVNRSHISLIKRTILSY